MPENNFQMDVSENHLFSAMGCLDFRLTEVSPCGQLIDLLAHSDQQKDYII